MEDGNSLVSTFGDAGVKLKRNKKTTVASFICRVLFAIVFNPIFRMRARKDPEIYQRCKARAINAAAIFFPYRHTGSGIDSSSQNGHIIVINHPTLNDPICAIIYALRSLPDREVIVPVNLPWFEGICKYRQHLLKMGINIVPILTARTLERLGNDPAAAALKTPFETHYMQGLISVMANCGVAVIAQQATRQPYVFMSEDESRGIDIKPTISFVLAAVKRAKAPNYGQIHIVPVGVVPHARATNGINFYRRYILNVGQSLTVEALSAIEYEGVKRPVDYHILIALAALLPPAFHGPPCSSDV